MPFRVPSVAPSGEAGNPGRLGEWRRYAPCPRNGGKDESQPGVEADMVTSMLTYLFKAKVHGFDLLLYADSQL